MLKDKMGAKAVGPGGGAPSIDSAQAPSAESAFEKAEVVEDGTFGTRDTTSGKGTQGVHRQKEYLKEADRLLKIKSQAKI